MDLNEALECANEFTLPGFMEDEDSLNADRMRNEDALVTLLEAWDAAPAGREPFSFDLVLSLADRNRDVCDRIGADALRNARSSCLAQQLSDRDRVRAVAALQGRSEKQVQALAGMGARDIAVAWVDAPVSGTVVGIDIETTCLDPSRGYVINVGLEFMEIETGTIHDPFSAYFGLPDVYAGKTIPCSDVHRITWADLDGKKLFREDKKAQRALLVAMCTYPYMAHNAAFEDSWFMLNIAGYAEARKAGKIVVVDTRDICRRLDPDVRWLPHDSHPASLESWARRRGTLMEGESERHLGLEDVVLMLQTVEAEFSERNMLKKA